MSKFAIIILGIVVICIGSANATVTNLLDNRWEDYPGMTCMDDDGESMALYRGISLFSRCKSLCTTYSKPCGAVTFNADSQHCYLKKSCKHLQNKHNGDESSVRVDNPPPCKPPTKVYCTKGSTSSKCLQYCGRSVGATEQAQQQCGGVVYICK